MSNLKRLLKALFVTSSTHKKVFKRKIDRDMVDVDSLINYLLEVEDKIYKNKK